MVDCAAEGSFGYEEERQDIWVPERRACFVGGLIHVSSIIQSSWVVDFWSRVPGSFLVMGFIVNVGNPCWHCDVDVFNLVEILDEMCCVFSSRSQTAIQESQSRHPTPAGLCSHPNNTVYCTH